MKADIILCWPSTADYPLWRRFIKNFRNNFREVIIVFTQTYGYEYDFKYFIRMAMRSDKITFLESPQVNYSEHQDWRNIATKFALDMLYKPDWIWFTEQDFFATKEFFDEVNNLEVNFEAIGVKEGPRLHPCSLFIKNSALELTKRDFSIIKDRGDHFVRIQQNIESSGLKIAYINENYKHFGGLTSNFHLILKNQPPNYKKVEFDEYLIECLSQKEIEIDDYFKERATNYLYKMNKYIIQTPPLSRGVVTTG
jgi:hypothetical protein